jgi:ribosomal-protein-alanine N-acetyltransferase
MIISSRHEGFEGIDAPVLPDVIPVKGAIVGISSALIYAPTAYVFVLGCDMPNVSEEALSYMVRQVNGEDVIIPRVPLGWEALHAIYGKSCIRPFLTAIWEKRFKIPALFPSLNVKELGEDPMFIHRGRSVFLNVNSENELAGASELANENEYDVRAMTASDLDRVLLIERLSFGLPWTRRLFEEALFSLIAANFVITVNERVVGYMCLYTVEDEAHILNVAIHPDRRKKGYGAALMGRVVDILKKQGITQFYLEVREGNLDAIRLYRKFGFVAVGKRKKYYTDTNEDALVMHLLSGNG